MSYTQHTEGEDASKGDDMRSMYEEILAHLVFQPGDAITEDETDVPGGTTRFIARAGEITFRFKSEAPILSMVISADREHTTVLAYFFAKHFKFPDLPYREGGYGSESLVRKFRDYVIDIRVKNSNLMWGVQFLDHVERTISRLYKESK